ncbi:MAG: hypothetical protein R2932_08550 [Caldilineaceae bacterium]
MSFTYDTLTKQRGMTMAELEAIRAGSAQRLAALTQTNPNRRSSAL